MATSTAESLLSISIGPTESNEGSEQIELDSLGMTSVIMSIVYFAVMVFLCGGNLLVVVSIKQTLALQTNTNIFVANLALADFCIGLQLVQRTISELKPEWMDNFGMCTSRFFITISMTSASGQFLVGIAIERCIGIFKPLHYPQLVTTRRVAMAVGAIWVYNVMFAMPCFFGSITWSKGMPCESFIVITKPYVHALVIHIWTYIGSITIIYVFILRVITQQQRRIGAAEAGGSSASEIKQNLRAVKTFAMVVGIFAVCWMPISVLLELQFYGTGDIRFTRGYILAYKVATVFLIINSAANPCVYALRMTSFRAPMKRILCCGRQQQENVNESVPNTSMTVAP